MLFILNISHCARCMVRKENEVFSTEKKGEGTRGVFSCYRNMHDHKNPIVHAKKKSNVTFIVLSLELDDMEALACLV